MKNKITEKINIVVNHPHPFRKVMQALKNRIKKPTGKMLGNFWCSKRWVAPEEAVKHVTGSEIDVLFDDKFAKEVNTAKNKTDNPNIQQGGANKDLLYHLAEYVKATRVIETGVAFGWSSLVFLLSISKRPNSLLISTDIPLEGEKGEVLGQAVPDELRKYWKLLVREGGDREALPEALKILPEIDICHYDSDKTPEGRMFAYTKLWNALRPGGILISDDVGDNLTFKKFAEQVKSEPIVVKSVGKGEKYVGILIK